MDTVELRSIGKTGAYVISATGNERPWRCYHETTSLLLLRGTQSQYRCQGIAGESEGEVILLRPPGSLHVTSHSSLETVAQCCFLDRRSDGLGARLGARRITDSTVIKALKELFHCMDRRSGGDDVRLAAEQREAACLAALEQSLEALAANAEARVETRKQSRSESAAPSSRGEPNRQAMLEAAELLRSMYAAEPREPVDIRSAAETLGVSYYWFVRSFNLALGLPPYQYVKHVRLAHARSLLAQGPTQQVPSLADLADSAGYTDGSHMSRDFRKAYNTSPSNVARGLNARWALRETTPPPVKLSALALAPGFQ